MLRRVTIPASVDRLFGAELEPPRYVEERGEITMRYRERRVGAIREAIDRTASALEQLDRGSPWGPDLKVSDDFLTPLFRAYLGALGLPTDLMTKKSFYELAEHVPLHELDPEVGEKLDAIAAIAASAMPAET